MVHFYIRILAFITGVTIGVLLAMQYKNNKNYVSSKYSQVPENNLSPSYNIWFEKQNLKRKLISWDILRYQKKYHFTESQYLYNKIKVLCIILVRKSKNVGAIKNTWSKGCTSIKFIELFGKSDKMPIKRSKENSSWIMLCTTLKDINNGYHWLVVANDNTFVIMENLRYFVANLNPNDRYYLGHAVTFWNTIYNSAEAGYLLSNGSLQALKNKFKDVDCSTNAYWNREDFYLGKHLSSLNITPSDTKDSNGLSVFHPYNWYHVFFPGESYYKTSVFPVKCCSENSITFQAIEGDKMYTYYYLLYTLQIFLDGDLGNRPLVDAVSEDKVWKQFLKERNVPSDNISSEQYYKLWEDLVDDPSSFAFHMKREMDLSYD